MRSVLGIDLFFSHLRPYCISEKIRRLQDDDTLPPSLLDRGDGDCVRHNDFIDCGLAPHCLGAAGEKAVRCCYREGA